MKFLINIIDAHLFELVLLKVLKAKYIKQADRLSLFTEPFLTFIFRENG